MQMNKMISGTLEPHLSLDHTVLTLPYCSVNPLFGTNFSCDVTVVSAHATRHAASMKNSLRDTLKMEIEIFSFVPSVTIYLFA